MKIGYCPHSIFNLAFPGKLNHNRLIPFLRITSFMISVLLIWLAVPVSVQSASWERVFPEWYHGKILHIWGSSETNVYMTNNKGVISHYDGSQLDTVYCNPFTDVNYIWGLSSSEIFVGGDGILYYDGLNWSKQYTGQIQWIWGTAANNLYAIQDQDKILHFNGSSWVPMYSPTAYKASLTSIWGNAPENIYAVGYYYGEYGPYDVNWGLIIHYDGTRWSENLTLYSALSGMWGSSTGDIYAIGQDGLILKNVSSTKWSVERSSHFDDLHAIWGSSPTNIYTIGYNGYLDEPVIIKYDGSAWVRQPVDGMDTISCIWGSSETDFYAWVNNNSLAHNDGSGWTLLPSDTISNLWKVWGTSANDIFALGYDGDIYHYGGKTWTLFLHETSAQFQDFWMNTADDLFIAGSSIYHYDGSAFSIMSPIPANSLWGSSSTSVFAAGNVIQQYDGVTWTTVSGYTDFYGIWGVSASDVFAVGRDQIVHYDGIVWSSMSVPTGYDFIGISGLSGNDVYAVGTGGIILHYDGITWSIINSGITRTLNDVCCFSPTDIHAAGADGMILHYDGASWSVAGVGNSCYTFRSIWGPDPDIVYAVGGDAAGLIYRYDNRPTVPVGSMKIFLLLLFVWIMICGWGIPISEPLRTNRTKRTES